MDSIGQAFHGASRLSLWNRKAKDMSWGQVQIGSADFADYTDYAHGLRRLKDGKMSFKVLTRIIFIFWMIAITVLSIIPHQDDSIIKNSNITESGMEKHLIAYFIAAFLCYYAFKKNHIVFILLSGCYIFLYSFALEALQFFLPYRTFNIKDVAANAFGIILFIIIWRVGLQMSMRRQKA